MNYKMDESEKRFWVNRIDQIIDRRLDRKGIIHTVSFARAQYILQYSRHKDIMLLNASNNTGATVAKFKMADPPCVLVSPSVDTGYDFPYDECEYQIIGKIPFPDNRAAVVQARMQQDKEFSNYTAAQTLVQMTGRNMRAADDRGENVIIDDNCGWFVYRNKQFFPKWWLNAFKKADGVTNPPPSLRSESQ